MNKRFYTLAVLVLSAMGLMAQMPGQMQEALPYYLPQTVVEVTVTMQSTTAQPGPYAKYAERYLGVTDAIQKASQTFVVKGIEIQTRGEADRRACYQAPLTAHVTLNREGVIRGVNLPACSASCHSGQAGDSCRSHKPAKPVQLMAPLNENVMLASGEAKVVESAATQIYKLRESRMNLLCGDWSDMPADGASTGLLLDEMKRTEQQLTELFTGTTKKHTSSVTLKFTPSATRTDTVLFRFSGEQGVVAGDDLSGRPYRLVMTVASVADASTAKASSKQKPALFYRLPAMATVKVLDDADNVVAETTCPVSQFGRLLTVPVSSYQTGEAIRWDSKTGALREVSGTGLGK